MMNKSEVQEIKKEYKEISGWVCPKCGKVWNPEIKTCTCSLIKQENLQTCKWIKD